MTQSPKLPTSGVDEKALLAAHAAAVRVVQQTGGAEYASTREIIEAYEAAKQPPVSAGEAEMKQKMLDAGIHCPECADIALDVIRPYLRTTEAVPFDDDLSAKQAKIQKAIAEHVRAYPEPACLELARLIMRELFGVWVESPRIETRLHHRPEPIALSEVTHGAVIVLHADLNKAIQAVQDAGVPFKIDGRYSFPESPLTDEQRENLAVSLAGVLSLHPERGNLACAQAVLTVLEQHCTISWKGGA